MMLDLLGETGPELGRRWLAALVLVPEGERERVIEAVEARIVEEHGQRHTGLDSQ